MCGIGGVLYADHARPVGRELLRSLGQTLAHRGPDAEGYWSEPGIGLVHRRLSIIDLAGGDQPISNEDESIQVVFNGEIYNFQDLRANLQAKGHRFRTHSDTEVLVHLYEEEGDRLVEQLRGMFAFALWDRKKRTLVLARDRLGIKPLYLYRDSEKLIFGSELKAILAYPGLQPTLSPDGLEAYLTFGMVPGAKTIFQQVEKLPPAHLLAVRADRLQTRPQRYWRLHLEPDPRPTVDEWQEAIRAKIDETVRLHLIADVPVGAFLSGGVDSSIIVQTAARLSGQPIQTFSIGFADEQFSELPYARQVAEQCGARHREEVVTPDAVSLLDELTHFYDEPFADSSAIPTFLVSRLASHSVKVVLSGDGGDEAFGGYARYAHDLKEAAIRPWLPRWLRRFAIGPLGAIWPKADWLPRPLRARTLFTNLALEPGAAYANTLSLCRPPLRRQLLSQDLRAQLNGYRPEDHVHCAYDSASPADPLAGMIAADVEVLLPDDFLVKVDRASMAHGLEVRPPLVDHELLEMAARIPSSLKVHRGQTKWILKQAYRDKFPGSLLSRPKHGFEMPIDSWLRGPLREVFEAAVLQPSSSLAPLVNQGIVARLHRAHLRGTSRHGAVLWSLLVFGRWADQYLTSLPSVAS